MSSLLKDFHRFLQQHCIYYPARRSSAAYNGPLPVARSGRMPMPCRVGSAAASIAALSGNANGGCAKSTAMIGRPAAGITSTNPDRRVSAQSMTSSFSSGLSAHVAYKTCPPGRSASIAAASIPCCTAALRRMRVGLHASSFDGSVNRCASEEHGTSARIAPALSGR